MTGWTLQHIYTQVTLPEMIMLLDYWTEHPPIHEMAASYLYGLGHRSSKKRTAQHNVKTDDPAFNAPFLSLFKGGVLRG